MFDADPYNGVSGASPSSARRSVSVLPSDWGTYAVGTIVTLRLGTCSIVTMRSASALETATKRVAKRPITCPSSHTRHGAPS